ncbi:MAG: hypothetical protein GYA46_03425, partial [candidate division Zixibacteria bacterium]|nr:hypothetical protein [candidate division Zixibacteria bacterium]
MNCQKSSLSIWLFLALAWSIGSAKSVDFPLGISTESSLEILYSPNLLMTTDSARYFSQEATIQAKGGRIRVAGVIHTGKFNASERYFAFVMMPQGAMKLTSDSLATYVYADEECCKRGNADPLVAALGYMNEKPILTIDSIVEDDPSAPSAKRFERNQYDNGIIRNSDANIILEEPPYDSDQYKKNICRHFDRAITMVHIFVDGSKTSGNFPELDWSESDYEFSISQSLMTLNHLSWLSESYAFPVTFYSTFRLVDIDGEPAYMPFFAWPGQANEALGYSAEYPGQYDLTWREMTIFSTPQAEPPRACRRENYVRDYGYGKTKQVFWGGPGTGRAAGGRTPGGVWLPV